MSENTIAMFETMLENTITMFENTVKHILKQL
jgi:hypothetical protein